MLNDAKVRAAKPREKAYKLTDSCRLYLLVKPGGSKSWKWSYSYNDKQRTLHFGIYPKVGLADARAQRDEAAAIGTAWQAIVATTAGGKPAWDIVIHQKLASGAFDMRDHFVVDRRTLLPVRFDSQRQRDASARGYHRIALTYGGGRVRGTRETATGTMPVDVATPSPTWEGNLWGVTFAALPLRRGGNYRVPFWQYDQGFGSFSVRVIGEEKVATPAGEVDAWVLEAGDGPGRLARYRIAKATRQELGYSAGPSSQRLGGVCAE